MSEGLKRTVEKSKPSNKGRVERLPQKNVHEFNIPKFLLKDEPKSSEVHDSDEVSVKTEASHEVDRQSVETPLIKFTKPTEEAVDFIRSLTLDEGDNMIPWENGIINAFYSIGATEYEDGDDNKKAFIFPSGNEEVVVTLSKTDAVAYLQEIMAEFESTEKNEKTPSESKDIEDAIILDEVKNKSIDQQSRQESGEILDNNVALDSDEASKETRTEEDKVHLVSGVTSFEDIYKIIDEVGEVQGSQMVYSPERLKKIIVAAESGDLPLDNVTETYGYRTKVAELIAERERRDNELVFVTKNAINAKFGHAQNAKDVTKTYQATGEYVQDLGGYYKAVSESFWDAFVRKHPDTARRKADAEPEIKKALERAISGRLDSLDATDTGNIEKFSPEFIAELVQALGNRYQISYDKTISDRISIEPMDGGSGAGPFELTYRQAKEYVRRKEEIKNKSDLPTKFEDEFGLTQGELESIPGFIELSEGQKKLIFQNLEEYVEAHQDSSLKSVWKGIRAWVNAEENEGTDGDAKRDYVEVVETLVKNMRTYGPKLVHEENGESLPDLTNTSFKDRKEKDVLWIPLANLNRIAHELAKTPAMELESNAGVAVGSEWRITKFFKDNFSSKRKEYNEYKALQASYERSKEDLAKALEKTGRYSPAEVARKLVELDARVHGLQFVQTAPEEVKTIQDIPDKSLWRKIGENMFKKENLGYMALGAVGRMATVGFLGFAAAPAWSSAIGGMRAWNKTAAEQREKDRAARMGKGTDTSNEALNIVQAVQTIEIAGEKRERGLTQRMRDLIGISQKSLQEIDEKLSNAEIHRDDEAISHFTAERDALVDRIRSRAIYMEDKLRLGRINFGPKEVYAKNMADFFEALAEAKMILADTDATGKSETEERLTQYLGYREGAIHDRRRMIQVKKATTSALRAGAFSLAGATLSDLVRGEGVFKVAETNITEPSPGAIREQVTVETPASNQSMSPKGYQAEVRAVDNQILEAAAQKEIAQMNPYEVKSGDTVYAIMKERLPFVKGLEPNRQDFIMKNILDSFSEEELQKIGVRTGDANRIFPGEKINIKMLNEILENRRLNLESGKISTIPSTVATQFAETSSLGDEMAASDVREQGQEYIASAQEYRTDGMDPVHDSPNPEVQTVYATPEFTGSKVSEFKERFFVGKITERDWESIRNKPITSIGTKYEDIYGGSDPLSKRIGLLREVVEKGAGVTPREGETVESFLSRGARVIADSEDNLKLKPQYAQAVETYNKVDTSRNYIAERASADRIARSEAAKEAVRARIADQERFARNSSLNEEPYKAGDMRRRVTDMRRSRRS